MTAVRRGFTVIELLVVLAVVALLISVAAPRYVAHLDRAQETVLRHNLRAIREALDKFYADRGRYPVDLQELVSARYLREMPEDPMTRRRDTWLVQRAQGQESGVHEVRSGAAGRAHDGTDYASW